MAEHFDIAVLGAGPGGYVAALKAAQLGASVAIVEKEYLGGTCLNYGCIPSKALLASAELVHHIHNAASFGIELDAKPIVNWAKIQARKDKVVQTLRGGIKALLGARKVKVFEGHGALNGPGKIVVTKQGGAGAELTADDIILATGSVPARIPGWPTDPAVVCTSDESLHWKTLPKSLLIVGGGVIGCEFACMMQALGVEVTIVEMLPHILPPIDVEIGQVLHKSLVARGVKILTGVKITGMKLADGGATATLEDGKSVTAERVLVATGRRPNTKDIGLERIGLTTERGFIHVDDQMRTAVKGYWCIGDANGRCLLAHAASAQGVAAVNNILGADTPFTSPIPSAVFTFPEIGAVGLTADEAEAQGHTVAVGTFQLSHLGKALAAGETEGLVKVVRDRLSGKLLGVHMVGHNATECIASAGALLDQQASVEEVAETVFAHPTISESIKEAAEDALSMGLHAAPKRMKRVAAVAE